MIVFFSTWARNIILAVLISVILEMMLLKSSKSSKYIKTMIGVYILYVIISPIINYFSREKIDFSNIEYEKYYTNKTYEEKTVNLKDIENSNFREVYELKIKQDIEEKLRSKGYIVSYIKLNLNMNILSEEYGAINMIEIKLSKNKIKDNLNTNTIYVEKIRVGDNKENDNEEMEEDKENLKDFLSKEYGIDINKVILK